MFTAKIKVRGRVQGVFLRHNTCQQAGALGLAGYVSNLPDGSVFIEVKGEKENIDQLIAWLETSPGQSEVVEVKVEPGKSDTSERAGFRIKYD